MPRRRATLPAVTGASPAADLGYEPEAIGSEQDLGEIDFNDPPADDSPEWESSAEPGEGYAPDSQAGVQPPAAAPVTQEPDWQTQYNELRTSSEQNLNTLRRQMWELQQGLMAQQYQGPQQQHPTQPQATNDPEPNFDEDPRAWIEWKHRDGQRQGEVRRAQQAQQAFNRRMRGSEEMIQHFQPEDWQEYQELVANNPAWANAVRSNPMIRDQVWNSQFPALRALQIARSMQALDPNVGIQSQNAALQRGIADGVAQALAAMGLQPQAGQRPTVAPQQRRAAPPRGSISNLPSRPPAARTKTNVEDLDNNQFERVFEQHHRAGRV